MKALALILLWEIAGADLWLMSMIGNAQGFPLREHWWLRVLLHEGARQLAMCAFLYLLLSAWRPLPGLRASTRLQRIEMLCGVALCWLAVSGLKTLSLTSCPWDLLQFGGMAHYVPHWLPGITDGGPGRCFPSGHAATGFAFFAVAIGLRQRRMFAVVLAFGLLCGAAQLLRGAHYPSHVLWTAWLCWVVAASNHAAFERLQRRDAIAAR